jgi:ATP-binding cassette subfamily B protein
MTMPGGFGGGMGGGFGGGMGTPGTSLPFAGIPPEYKDRIEELLRDEPDEALDSAPFDHRAPADPRFGLRSFLTPHWRPLLAATGLIGLEQVAVHSGPFLAKLLIDEAVVPRRLDVFGWVIGLYLLAIVLGWWLMRTRIRFTARLGHGLMESLRIKVFTHIQRLGLDFYTRERGGRIMTRMTSDITALGTLFHEGIINVVVQVLTLAVVAGVLLHMKPTLAGVLLVGVVPPMVALTIWFQKRSTVAYAAVRERIADVLTDFQESLAGVRVVAMHNRQRHNIVHHRNVIGRHVDANLRAASIAARYGPATQAIEVGGQCLIFMAGGVMLLRGTLTPGELAAFVLYVGTVFGPIQELVQLYNTYQSGNAAVRKLREVLATDTNVPEAEHASELPPIRGELRFEDVDFAYTPGRPVLRGIDLCIAPGETVAFVGATGAGKSTLAKLILRFYDPERGRICVDGHDLRDVTLTSLRRQIGVVPQEPFLFAGTVRDNIAFARPEATDDEVLAACEAVGITELIDQLPRGIHTACHERGVTLSSGERQLIALARAFMAQPRVLVLDEATSNLDLKTESKIARALDSLLGGRTAILIAHRLSTAMRAGRIAVIHDGAIVELGSHDALISKGGRYAEMYGTWRRGHAESAA